MARNNDKTLWRGLTPVDDDPRLPATITAAEIKKLLIRKVKRHPRWCFRKDVGWTGDQGRITQAQQGVGAKIRQAEQKSKAARDKQNKEKAVKKQQDLMSKFVSRQSRNGAANHNNNNNNNTDAAEAAPEPAVQGAAAGQNKAKRAYRPQTVKEPALHWPPIDNGRRDSVRKTRGKGNGMVSGCIGTDAFTQLVKETEDESKREPPSKTNTQYGREVWDKWRESLKKENQLMKFKERERVRRRRLMTDNMANNVFKKWKRRWVRTLKKAKGGDVCAPTRPWVHNWWLRECRKRNVWDTRLLERVSLCMSFVRDTDPVTFAYVPGDSRVRLPAVTAVKGDISIVSFNGGGKKPLLQFMETAGWTPHRIPDVIAAQELNLLATEPMRLPPGWSGIYQQRGGDGRGGGVGLFHHSTVKIEAVPRMGRRAKPGGKNTMEWIWGKIGKVQTGCVYICCVYAPPHCKTKPVSQLITEAASLRDEAGCIGVFITGDLNTCLLSNAEQERAGCKVSPYKGMRTAFLSALENEGVAATVLNRKHLRWTHTTGMTHTLLDQCLFLPTTRAQTLQPDKVKFRVLTRDGGSGHRPLWMAFPLHVPHVPFTPRINYAKLWRGTMEQTQSIATELKEALESNGPPGGALYEEWSDKLEEVCKGVLGLTRPLPITVSSVNKPWWCRELSEANKKVKKKRRRLWQVRKRVVTATNSLSVSAAEQRARLEYQEASKKWERLYERTKEQYWRERRRSYTVTDPALMKEAFSVFRRMRGGCQQTGVTHSQSVMDEAWGAIISSEPPENSSNVADKVIVDAWRAELETREETLLAEEAIKVTVEEVETVKKHLRRGTAAGMDGFRNELLKLLPETWVESLADLFTQILQRPVESIPAAWKRSLVCMIQKCLHPSPIEHRPITLLSCVAKMLESIVQNRLYLREAKNGHGTVPSKLHSAQAGFKRGRGCLEQVWTVAVLDQEARREGKELLAVTLDLKKAFDSVPHETLLKRMIEIGVPDHIVRFVDAWLRGHVREVLAGGNDEERTQHPVRRSVPQGGVLSSLLFDIFIDSVLCLLDGVEGLQVVGLGDMDGEGGAGPGGPNKLAYADDTILLAHFQAVMQSALGVFSVWCRDNGIEINPAKCEAIRLGYPGKGELRLQVEETVIKVSTRVKYLGVYLKTSRRQTMKPKFVKYVLDSEEQFKEIKDWKSNGKWFIQAPRGCPMNVAGTIAHATFAPKLYYGSVVYPHVSVGENSQRNSRALQGLAKIGKALLGTYDTANNVRTLDFLGWEHPRDATARHTVKFAVKLANHSCEYIRKLFKKVRKALNEEEADGWWEHVRQCVRLCVDKDWLSVDTVKNALDGDEVAVSVVNSSLDHRTPRAHPLVSQAIADGHSVFPFVTNRLSPLTTYSDDGTREVFACVACDEEKGDGPDHLFSGQCGKNDVNVLARRLADALGCSLAELSDKLKHNGMWFSKELSLTIEKWRHVAAACRDMWRLRGKLRKERDDRIAAARAEIAEE